MGVGGNWAGLLVHQHVYKCLHGLDVYHPSVPNEVGYQAELFRRLLRSIDLPIGTQAHDVTYEVLYSHLPLVFEQPEQPVNNQHHADILRLNLSGKPVAKVHRLAQGDERTSQMVLLEQNRHCANGLILQVSAAGLVEATANQHKHLPKKGTKGILGQSLIDKIPFDEFEAKSSQLIRLSVA